jgi:hypothetical protein
MTVVRLYGLTYAATYIFSIDAEIINNSCLSSPLLVLREKEKKREKEKERKGEREKREKETKRQREKGRKRKRNSEMQVVKNLMILNDTWNSNKTNEACLCCLI